MLEYERIHNKTMVFVGGAHYSGTSLLEALLDTSTHISVGLVNIRCKLDIASLPVSFSSQPILWSCFIQRLFMQQEYLRTKANICKLCT